MEDWEFWNEKEGSEGEEGSESEEGLEGEEGLESEEGGMANQEWEVGAFVEDSDVLDCSLYLRPVKT
jgi:hypothetical protein